MNEIAAAGTPSSEVSLINFISQAVRDPTIDIGKLESLIRIQREIAAEQASAEFNRAMSAAQGEMRPVVRDASNEQTRSRYARLETIDDLIRPIYTKHGFSLTFNTERPEEPGNIRIVCKIAHSGGHCETYALEAAPDVMGAKGNTNKTALHGLGSTVSYLRRYLTCMIYNVVLTNDDDDGNAGGGKAQNRRDQPPREQRQQDETNAEYERRYAQSEARRDDPTHDAVEAFLSSVHGRLASCQTLADVAEVEQHGTIVRALARPPSAHRDRLERMIAQRKADLRPAPAFDAVVIDQHGEIVGEATTAVSFARQIAELWHKADIDGRAEIEEHNADGIALARDDAAAAAILAALDEEPVDKSTSQPNPTEDAERQPPAEPAEDAMAFEPVRPIIDRGKPAWAQWVNALRDDLSFATPARLDAWLAVQEPTLREAPLAHRAGAIKAITAAYVAAQRDPPAMLAELLRPAGKSDQAAKDHAWATGTMRDLEQIPTDASGRDYFNRIVSSESARAAMARIKVADPELFERIDGAFAAANKALPPALGRK